MAVNSATGKYEYLKSSPDHSMKRVAIPTILTPAQVIEDLSKDLSKDTSAAELTSTLLVSSGSVIPPFVILLYVC